MLRGPNCTASGPGELRVGLEPALGDVHPFVFVFLAYAQAHDAIEKHPDEKAGDE